MSWEASSKQDDRQAIDWSCALFLIGRSEEKGVAPRLHRADGPSEAKIHVYEYASLSRSITYLGAIPSLGSDSKIHALNPSTTCLPPP